MDAILGAQADVDHTSAAAWSSFECSPLEPIPSGLLQWLHVAFTPAVSLLFEEPEGNQSAEVT